RRWTTIEFFRRQVGGSEGLGQAVHQEDSCARKGRPQDLQNSLRHGSARIGDIAQIGGSVFSQRGVGLNQQSPNRWYASQTRDPLFHHHIHNLLGKHEIHQNQSATLLKRRRQLIQSS